MDATDLLMGPRGLAVCREYLNAQNSSPTTPPYITKAWPGKSFAALVASARSARYWEPDDLTESSPTELSLSDMSVAAAQIAQDPLASWWDDEIDLKQQTIIYFEHAQSPGLKHMSRNRGYYMAEARRPAPETDRAGQAIDWTVVTGAWWSVPKGSMSLITTLSGGAPAVPAGLAFEDWSLATSWPVQVLERARIFEIKEPADWVYLVGRYPVDVSATTKRSDWWRATNRDGKWLMPDWERIALEWDAVHLTVLGYLTTASRVLYLDDDYATILAGAQPGFAYWLSNVFHEFNIRQDWRRNGVE